MKGRHNILSLDVPDPETGFSLGDILENTRYDTETVVFIYELKAAFFHLVKISLMR